MKWVSHVLESFQGCAEDEEDRSASVQGPLEDDPG